MKLGLEPEWLELERSCAKFSRFSSLCCLFSFHHNARHVDVHKSMPSCGERRPCNDIHLFYGTKCWITRNTNKKVYFNNRKTKLCVVSFWLKYGLWIKLSQKNNDSFYDIKICRWTPLCWSYHTNPILYSWNITFLRFDSNKQEGPIDNIPTISKTPRYCTSFCGILGVCIVHIYCSASNLTFRRG